MRSPISSVAKTAPLEFCKEMKTDLFFKFVFSVWE